MARLKRTIWLPDRMVIEYAGGRTHSGHVFGSRTSLLANHAFKRITASEYERFENQMSELGDDDVTALKRDLRSQFEPVLIRAAAPDASVELTDGDGCVRLRESNELRTLCFDPAKHLLVKVVDEATGETMLASEFDDVDGVKLPWHRVVTGKDGRSEELELMDVRAAAKAPSGQSVPPP